MMVLVVYVCTCVMSCSKPVEEQPNYQSQDTSTARGLDKNTSVVVEQDLGDSCTVM